jgi:hypothetical protein
VRLTGVAQIASHWDVDPRERARLLVEERKRKAREEALARAAREREWRQRREVERREAAERRRKEDEEHRKRLIEMRKRMQTGKKKTTRAPTPPRAPREHAAAPAEPVRTPRAGRGVRTAGAARK